MRLIMAVVVLVMLSGCGSTSYDPWLAEDSMVGDDRLAGVWQGDCDVSGSEPAGMGDLVIAAVQWPEIGELEELPPDAPGGEDQAPPPPVYYQVVYFPESVLRGVDLNGRRLPEIRPRRYFASLHEIDGTFLLQLSGQFKQAISDQLVTPLYMLFKVEYSEVEVRLHKTAVRLGRTEAELREHGLQFRNEGEGNFLFFSLTEDLEAFVRLNLTAPEFFEEQPSVILKRISDLREPPEEVLDGFGPERDE